MPKLPKLRQGKARKVIESRSIITEESERILDEVPAMVGEKAVRSWRRFLIRLWASGLRSSESLELYWDRSDRL